MNNDILGNKRNAIVSALLVLLVLGSLFLAAKTFGEFKRVGTIGDEIPPQNTITVSGVGEEFATPDLAVVTFDITEEAKSVADAQKVVNQKMEDITAYLKTAGVAEKDIRTIGYNIYPRYEYRKPGTTQTFEYYPNGERVLVGYNVTQSTEVKVRKTDDASKILNELGNKKVTNLSGLQLTIDDEEKVKDLARDKAIEDAKDKAAVLARQLGVDLGRIVSFNESGHYPMYFKAEYARDGAAMAQSSVANEAGVISTGQNKITSNVTITFEIR